MCKLSPSGFVLLCFCVFVFFLLHVEPFGEMVTLHQVPCLSTLVCPSSLIPGYFLCFWQQQQTTSQVAAKLSANPFWDTVEQTLVFTHK